MCIHHTSVHLCRHPVRSFIPWTENCKYRTQRVDIEYTGREDELSHYIADLMKMCSYYQTAHEVIVRTNCPDCQLRREIEEKRQRDDEKRRRDDEDVVRKTREAEFYAKYGSRGFI